MLMDLDRSDLECLVKSSEPSYELISKNSMIAYAGHFSGGMGDHWCWDNIDKWQDEDLLEIYLLCKNSWIKK